MTRRASRALFSVTLLLSGCGSDSTGERSDAASDVSADHDAGIDAAESDATLAPDADGESDADAAPPLDDGPIGWASVAGYGVATTTGGGDQAPVVVSSLDAFNDSAGGDSARVLHVSGEISGQLKVGSNKTIVGLPGAKLHGSLALNGSVNVILRNLTIVGYNCYDTNDCGNGADAIVLRDAHHVWLDRLDISDGSDGNLDIVQGSDLVTVSWTKFHYSEERAPNTGNPHRFSNLIGSSDGATGDIGRLRVTFHHVWWADRVMERMPRVRFGLVHVFNSLYTAAGNSSCVGLGFDGNVLLEKNAFIGVKDPIRTSNANEAAIVESIDNLYVSTTGTNADKNPPAFTPPYAYALEPVSGVQASVQAGVGPK
jgi:pectate lyase